MYIREVKVSITFTSNSKCKIVQCDQVSPLLVIYYSLFRHINNINSFTHFVLCKRILFWVVFICSFSFFEKFSPWLCRNLQWQSPFTNMNFSQQINKKRRIRETKPTVRGRHPNNQYDLTRPLWRFVLPHSKPAIKQLNTFAPELPVNPMRIHVHSTACDVNCLNGQG